MTFIKKNKKLICALIGIILFLILVVLFIKALLPDSSKTVWGNRLDGIEEHQILDEDIEKIKEEIINSNKVSAVRYISTGNLLNFIITVNDDVNRNGALSLLSCITNNISKDNQEYYDIQVYFTKNSDDAAFPFIGYKHKTSSEFSIGG